MFYFKNKNIQLEIEMLEKEYLVSSKIVVDARW